MYLSFIIPLYNCESYIADCLDSIYATNLLLEDYEVIIIDDGSKDDGVKIIKDYCKKYNNIILIQQENQGASIARNVGIDNAQGEYVWFVDADDRIDGKVLDVVFDSYKNDNTIDLFCFNHTSVNFDGNVLTEEFKKPLSLTGCAYIERHPYYYLWNKIFKKSSLGEIRFPQGTRNTEDWYFDLVSIINMQKVICIPMNGYYYNCTNMSSTLRTRSAESIKKNAEDTQLMHSKIVEVINHLHDSRKIAAIREALHYSVAGFFYAQFVDGVRVKELKKIVKRYKENGLYPIPQTHSRRANKFLVIANRPMWFYTAAYLHRMSS